MTDQKHPDDRELDQYLKGDSPLSRRYRDASGEAAPPELDEAILAQARAELKRKPPSVNRYLAPVALAASVVLGVNLAWNVYQAEPVPPEAQRLEKAATPDYVPDPPPPAAPEPAPVASPPEVARRAPAAPPAKLEEKLAERRLDEAGAAAAMREREQLAAVQENEQAALQSEERAAMSRRSEAESSRRAMLQAQDAAGAAASSAAPGESMDVKAKKTSDARAMLPPGWHLLGAADRYEAAVDESNYRSGPSSLVMWRSAPGVDLCGRLETAAPSAGLAGKTVRLKAAVRMQGTQRASLFVSYSLAGQVQWPLATRPVAAADGAWLQGEMTHTIPSTADEVVYGALLCGAGTLWLDDVELEVVTGR